MQVANLFKNGLEIMFGSEQCMDVFKVVMGHMQDCVI